jgi:hypothetical protein
LQKPNKFTIIEDSEFDQEDENVENDEKPGKKSSEADEKQEEEVVCVFLRNFKREKSEKRILLNYRIFKFIQAKNRLDELDEYS